MSNDLKPLHHLLSAFTFDCAYVCVHETGLSSSTGLMEADKTEWKEPIVEELSRKEPRSQMFRGESPPDHKSPASL